MTHYTFPASGPLRVAAQLYASDLELQATDTAEASVALHPLKDNATTHAYLEQTLVDLRGDELRIETPKTTGSWFGSTPRLRVVVTVPTDSSLKVSSGSGDVDARGILTIVDIRSGSGDTTLEHATEVRVAAGSGDARVDSLTEGEFTTGSGDITLGTATGKVRTKSGSGDLRIDSAADVNSITASGDTRIGSFAGTAHLRTASGDIDITSALSGSISAVTASGDITVGVRAGTAVLLDCISAAGNTRTDLSGTDAPSDGEHRLELRARAASGDVSVKRA